MKALRVTLVVSGGAVLAWGCWLLLTGQTIDQLLSVALWLIAVVVVHDGSLALVSALRHRFRAAPPSPAAAETDEGTP